MDEEIDTGAVPLITPNVDEVSLRRNKKANIAKWQYLPPVWEGLEEVALIGGGPSLPAQFYKIEQLRDQGVQLATVNGAHHWAMMNTLWPSFQIIVDARESNARFTHPCCPGTYYLIADHCSPKILSGLNSQKTFLWNPKGVRGGSTVMLNAIPLLKLMGAKKIHIFGFDSCYANDLHHAYEQPENENEYTQWIDVDGRSFLCSRWMVSQAEEFLELKDSWGDFTVYGNGLIAWINEVHDVSLDDVP